jgi:hypothetical protein
MGVHGDGSHGFLVLTTRTVPMVFYRIIPVNLCAISSLSIHPLYFHINRYGLIVFYTVGPRHKSFPIIKKRIDPSIDSIYAF